MLTLQRHSIHTRLRETRGIVFVVILILGLLLLTQLGLDLREGAAIDFTAVAWRGVLLRYALAMLAFNLLIGLLKPQVDQLLFPLIGLLGGMSLALLYRLPTPYWDEAAGQIAYATRNMWYVERQALFLMIGQAIMLVVILLPGLLRWLRDYRYVSILLGLALLLGTAVFGVEAAVGGPRVSLNLGLFSFQPAELIKLLFVIYLASYLRYVRPDLKKLTYRPLRVVPIPHFSQLRPILLVLLSTLVFLVWMSDLGAALILFFIFPAMMYLALPRKVFWYLAALVVIGAYLMLGGLNWLQSYGLEPLSTESAPTIALDAIPQRLHDGWQRVAQRFASQQDPWAACTEDNGCASYQTLHGVYALAAGGLIGVGPGQGLAGNIPFVYTDMVYAAIGEEWGLAGAAALLLLYWLLVRRGLHIARQQADTFNALLAAGIVTIITLQIVIIVGGVVAILPLTGITLPFISYGGTSILVNSLMIGLLLRLSTTGGHASASHEVVQNVTHLQQLYALAFGLLFLATAYWALWMHPQLDPAFPTNDAASQNPVAWQRHAAWLERVDRGQILAADGTVLAANSEWGRTYYLPSAAHVVGQADGRGQGLSGLELAYNDTLLGRGRYDLPTLWAQQFAGQWPGNDLILTLEPRWQQAAHEGLGGYNGAVVVLDAQTGAVLAMVSHPLYDPTAVYDQTSIDAINATWDTPFLNRATHGLYPPGSTFKTVIGATAISQGITTPDTPYDFLRDVWYWDEAGQWCHKQWVGAGVIVSCNADQQQMTFSEGFAASDNILFAQLATQLGAEAVGQGAADFGFGQAAPFDLPTAASQLAADAAALRDPAQLAMTGFGQAQVAATPLQMALVAAAIANEGNVPRPYLVSEVRQPNGKSLSQTRPQTWQRALSKADAATMVDVMVHSVETGWANSAAVDEGLTIGGKTGTAEWAGTTRGQLPHSWFIGFAEMPNGRVVAVAVLAEAAGDGSAVAAPVAGYILAQLAQ